MEPGYWYVYLKSSPRTLISSQVCQMCYVSLQEGLLPTLTDTQAVCKIIEVLPRNMPNQSTVPSHPIPLCPTHPPTHPWSHCLAFGSFHGTAIFLFYLYLGSNQVISRRVKQRETITSIPGNPVSSHTGEKTPHSRSFQHVPNFKGKGTFSRVAWEAGLKR